MAQKRSFIDNKSLAQLTQVFDTIPVDRLEHVLTMAKGDIDLAAAIDNKEHYPRKQTTLFEFTTDKESKRQRITSTSPKVCEPTLESVLPFDESSKPVNNNVAPSINEKLRWSSSNDTNDSNQQQQQRRRRPTRTIELYRPEDIARHTPCELILDFLPADLANNLLEDMLTISKGWKRNRRWLFDREIVSPHTSSFFVHPEGSWTRKPQQTTDTSNTSDTVENAGMLVAQREEQHWDQAWNYYSGQRSTNAPTFSPLMIKAAELVRQIVNDRISKRERHPYESKETWFPSVAASNCYASAKESVDWHSDTLTYLGPMPTIASLSLGAGRPFRLQSYALASSTTGAKTYSIYLPHNSLLLMHPPTQEQWRHQIPAAPVHPHPLAGLTRINITFRHYRRDQALSGIPRCSCNLPCQLRSVTRREKNFGKYFYCCQAAYSQQGRQCSFFAWWQEPQATISNSGNSS
ncbi:hypothetical protein BDF22DRAFT_678581 [Syncephalis plumigaleata]|nr:hypothetical protein BDF22DRAFT_678581 [Syncephalis plumigaleata]